MGILDPKPVTPAGLDSHPRLSATALSATYGGKKYQDVTRKQSELLGGFMHKLRTGVAVTIAAMGDSTTYGHDTVSADKVAPPAGALPDGSTHTNTRSPAPWPSVLESRLDSVYAAGVTVINRGYSGDTVNTAYPRWSTSSGANLTLMSYGINDSATVTLENYVTGYENLILREIMDRGSAVVILTPMKNQTPNGDPAIDAYGNSIRALASKYGIPVIDLEPMLGGYASDCWSDFTHLNTKGNSIIGARLASIFIGEGPNKPNHVMPGTRLATRPPLDNVTYGAGATVSTIAAAGTVPEGSANTAGVIASVGGASIYYSFYADAADMLVVPNYYMANGAGVSVELDFGIEQPHDVLNALVGVAPSHTARAASTVTDTTSGAAKQQTGIGPSYKYLRIASPGWHTLKVTGTGAGAVYIHALEFLTYRGFKTAVAGATPMVVPAAMFSSITGAPALLGVPGVGYPASWQMDAATTETIATLIPPTPEDWITVELAVWWAATNTTAGDVRLSVAYNWLVAGSLPNNTVGQGQGTVTATSPGVTGQAVRTVVVASIPRQSNPATIRVTRLGADAADTYAADIAIITIELARVS